jgi:hypothetical protein
MFTLEYVGFGYPSTEEIVKKGKKEGYTHYFWATESIGYKGIYNGDTVVLYTDENELPIGKREDARKYGHVIE